MQKTHIHSKLYSLAFHGSQATTSVGRSRTKKLVLFQRSFSISFHSINQTTTTQRRRRACHCLVLTLLSTLLCSGLARLWSAAASICPLRSLSRSHSQLIRLREREGARRLRRQTINTSGVGGRNDGRADMDGYDVRRWS